MYLGKARINDMAQYINRLEADLNYHREAHGFNDMVTEARGAYFAALKMARYAGVQKEVHEAREKLKEAS